MFSTTYPFFAVLNLDMSYLHFFTCLHTYYHTAVLLVVQNVNIGMITNSKFNRIPNLAVGQQRSFPLRGTMNSSVNYCNALFVTATVQMLHDKDSYHKPLSLSVELVISGFDASTLMVLLVVLPTLLLLLFLLFPGLFLKLRSHGFELGKFVPIDLRHLIVITRGPQATQPLSLLVDRSGLQQFSGEINLPQYQPNMAKSSTFNA